MAINPLGPNAVNQALFSGADKSKSKKLDAGEFAKVLSQVGSRDVSQADAREVLQQLDADGDGQLNLQEFERANLAASVSVNNAGPNLYQALQGAGVASSNASSNIYTNLLSGSLGGSFTSTGSLVGQLVGGAVTSKLA